MNQKQFVQNLANGVATRKTWRGCQSGSVLGVRTSTGVIDLQTAVERFAGKQSLNAALSRNLAGACSGNCTTPAEKRLRSQLISALGC